MRADIIGHARINMYVNISHAWFKMAPGAVIERGVASPRDQPVVETAADGVVPVVMPARGVCRDVFARHAAAARQASGSEVASEEAQMTVTRKQAESAIRVLLLAQATASSPVRAHTDIQM